MSVISSMKKSKATTPHPAPGGTDPLRSHLGCLRFAWLSLRGMVTNTIPSTRRPTCGPTHQSTVGRLSADCRPTVSQRVFHHLYLNYTSRVGGASVSCR